MPTRDVENARARSRAHTIDYIYNADWFGLFSVSARTLQTLAA